jgi:hypothetical protein
MQVWCGARTLPWQDPTIPLCPDHSCLRFGSACLFGSCGPDSTIVNCPPASEDRIPIEVDPEDPEVVLLRPEHLPRLRGQLQMELAQIDEIAHRKGEIESQLEELDSAEKELKKRSGGR